MGSQYIRALAILITLPANRFQLFGVKGRLETVLIFCLWWPSCW